MDGDGRGSRLTRLGRVSKSLLVAGASTLIALLSHVAAGGAIPALQGVIVPFALAAIICLPLSGRLRSLPRLVAAVVLSQLLYHWLFVLGAPATATLVAVDSGASGHHAGHAFLLLGGDAALAGDALMWASHGIAAVASVVLIRRGETALVGLQRLLSLVARTILPTLPVLAPLGTRDGSRTIADADPPTPIGRRLTVSVTRRGPPATA